MSLARPHDEGQISILTLGFFALLLMVCAVVLGATAVNLQARHLLAAADGAVSAAVEQHAVAPGSAPSLSSQQIRSSAEEHLRLQGRTAATTGSRLWRRGRALTDRRRTCVLEPTHSCRSCTGFFQPAWKSFRSPTRASRWADEARRPHIRFSCVYFLRNYL
ncbi:pilus assembly protein TadG-related protein [Nesterenkonia sp. NBAIMH1]|uniref:pilus assembly protein TadG-related protein n=1 Tax=Nesterenkonia sp. NBAIMH1 TaxID=2600320 RepID=UPI001AEF5B76|nr:pilus assembly protein TadG-related protein [Nesterenkonia sp. NBAIMH1]